MSNHNDKGFHGPSPGQLKSACPGTPEAPKVSVTERCRTEEIALVKNKESFKIFMQVYLMLQTGGFFVDFWPFSNFNCDHLQFNWEGENITQGNIYNTHCVVIF